MNLRVRVFWAIFLTIVAGIGTYVYLETLRLEIGVVVASQTIPPRTVITSEMIQVAKINGSAKVKVLPLAFEDPTKVIGAVAVQEIPKGEVLRNDSRWVTTNPDAAAAAGKQRLSYFLPEGTRAISIVVDAQGVVAGRVKQGDLVDIVFTSRDDSTGGIYSALILQHVHVLGIEMSGSSSGSHYQVTLLVTPEQALDLTLAKRRGTLDLALTPRNPEPVNIPPASPLKFRKMGQVE